MKMDFVNSYLKWLKDEMYQEEVSPGLYEITTPFLDRHNDYTQIYAQICEDGKIRFSDMGITILDLEMSGVDFSTKKRKSIFNLTLNRLGVSESPEKALFIDASSVDEVPKAKHQLLQAILTVNDMFFLNRAHVSSLFFDDIISFFQKNDIYYSKNPSFVGKSKLMNTFDFSLQKNSHNPERLIKALNNPTIGASKNIIFSWEDTKEMRDPGTCFIVLVNDEEGLKPDIGEAFMSYGITLVPWSQREVNLEKFA